MVLESRPPVQGERRQPLVEEKLAHLRRLYSVLSAINQAIVRTEARQRLFDEACRIAIEEGLFRMAWIGILDPATSAVSPVARAGHDDGYLAAVRIVARDEPEGRGPTGLAVRTGRYFVCRDVETDQTMLPWRAPALERGYRSTIALPLKVAGTTIGAFTLYAAERDFFDDDEVRLACALADDISFALESMDRQARRESAEDAVRRSEEKYRMLVESASDGIFLTDPGGRWLDANRAGCEMLGYARDELVGKHVGDLSMPDGVPPLEEELARLASGEKIVSAHRMRKKDGSVLLVEVSAKAMPDGSVQAIVRDLTERTKLQEQLRLADRMASVGTLAAGVAHEINNPLAYALLNVDQLSEQVADRSRGAPFDFAEAASMLADAKQGLDRVRRIVRDLKTFSRPDDDARGPVDVRAALESAAQIAANEVRHRARLLRAYDDVLPVYGSESRLGQVFLNLIVNAAHAIPEGAASSNTIRLSTLRGDGATTIVEIADTGAGMTDEVRARIFDPFFTTKPVGVGTGLGLSICHGIVSALGGSIAVESAPGRGTTFRLTFPAHAGEVEARREAPRGRTEHRRARILIVDDEPAVGAALQRALDDFEVELAHGGARAIELCLANEYDCVLCDLMMPDVSGMEVFEAVRRERPGREASIVFMTGGTFTPRARHFLESVPNERIEKPFDLDALRASLARRAGSA